MLRKLLLIGGLVSLTNVAYGQWVGSAGYYDLTADIDGYETSPDLWGIGLGWEFETGIRDFTITPGITLYGGIDDDIVKVNDPSTSKVRVETQFAANLNVRFRWEGDSPLYFYVAPAYARFDIEGEEGNVEIKDDEWHAGIGAGIGYRITDRIDLELSYDEFGDADVLGLALRFGF